MLQTIIRKSSNQIKLLNQYLTNLVEEIENSINELIKAVAVFELQNKHETKSNAFKNLVQKNILWDTLLL